MVEGNASTTSDCTLSESPAAPELRTPGPWQPAAPGVVAMNIVARPLGRGRFAAYLCGRLLCRSRTPLLAAARILQAMGVSDDTLLTMTHEHSATVALRSTIGRAAGLRIREIRGTPRLVPWRPDQLPGEGSSTCTAERLGGKMRPSGYHNAFKSETGLEGAVATGLCDGEGGPSS